MYSDQGWAGCGIINLIVSVISLAGIKIAGNWHGIKFIVIIHQGQAE